MFLFTFKMPRNRRQQEKACTLFFFFKCSMTQNVWNKYSKKEGRAGIVCIAVQGVIEDEVCKLVRIQEDHLKDWRSDCSLCLIAGSSQEVSGPAWETSAREDLGFGWRMQFAQSFCLTFSRARPLTLKHVIGVKNLWAWDTPSGDGNWGRITKRWDSLPWRSPREEHWR